MTPPVAFLQAGVEALLRRDPPGDFPHHRHPAPHVLDRYPLVPFVVHRRPKLWPDPERFDPNRFAPEHESARPRFALIPFGGGPRGCIGNQFAMVEARLDRRGHRGSVINSSWCPIKTSGRSP